MIKESLTPNQLNNAKKLDKLINELSKLKEEVMQYKLGDVYILEEWYSDTPEHVEVQQTNMGFPVKYQVVYISPEGVPYLRKLTSTGNPTGDVLFPPEISGLKQLQYLAENALYNSVNYPTLCERFVPDPEQLDSILLQTEFDPTAQQRDKSKLFNEINKHNKAIAIPTDYYSYNKIGDFFKSTKPGDKFWTSPDKQYVIQSVTRIGREWVIKTTDINKATATFNISSFIGKRLYRAQPRSFSKETKV